MDEILSYAIMVILLSIVYWFDQRDKNKHNKKAGIIGEDIVANRLNQLNSDYVVENNVHFCHNQIDHLVINHELKICFVIETKYWNGIITGKLNDTYWQQDKNGDIKYYPNPILQNEHHCHEVRRYYNGYHIYNIVVFVKNKNIPRHRCIINENGVLGYIKKVSISRIDHLFIHD